MVARVVDPRPSTPSASRPDSNLGTTNRIDPEGLANGVKYAVGDDTSEQRAELFCGLCSVAGYGVEETTCDGHSSPYVLGMGSRRG